MKAVASRTNILLIFFLFLPEATTISQALSDTIAINKHSVEAYNISRRNPEIAIIMARQSISASHNLNYKKGVANASLALGMAYLTRYNPGDSALFYNNQALTLYEETGDVAGKARACYGLAYVFSFKGDLESSGEYSALALQYFEEDGDYHGMINSLNALSYLAKQRQDLDGAITYIERAISIACEVKDTLPLADATNSLGNIYKEMALFSQAIDSYFDALKLWEIKGDSAGMSVAYGSIGLAYFYQKDYDRALEFSRKHLLLSEKRKDLWEVSKICNTIAQIYNSRGLSDSALIYQRRSLALNREMNYPSGEASSYFNIASTLLHLMPPDSAQWYMKQAMDIAAKINMPVPPEYYITLGNIEQALGNFQQAFTNSLKAYALGKERDLPMVVSDASLLLSDIYSRTGKEDLAYRYLKEYMQLSDSISNDDFLKQVTRMEMQYDFDKKQKEAEFIQMQEKLVRDQKIKQQGLYLKGLGILLVLVAIMSVLYLRHIRLRAQYEHIDLEQRLLRAQMNPHFIFNSLCAIQDLIFKDKPQRANTFLTKIARLMRNILENSREEYVALDKEVETLRLYLDVQQLRFENGFKYSLSVDESIDAESISIPPMLAQPCVENSIEHGLLPGKGNGWIDINYTINKKLITLEVTDNGVGREKAAEVEPAVKKQSISTKLTEKRLEHFRRILKEKNISYKIIDLYEEGVAAGTKVVMMLPYKNIFS